MLLFISVLRYLINVKWVSLVCAVLLFVISNIVAVVMLSEAISTSFSQASVCSPKGHIVTDGGSPWVSSSSGCRGVGGRFRCFEHGVGDVAAAFGEADEGGVVLLPSARLRS